jgi:hypothetical protein
MERKYHFVLLQFIQFLSFLFSGEISSSIVSYQNGAAHAFISSLHPFTFLASSFKVSFQKTQQHFIANNLFKEFLINDRMGNEMKLNVGQGGGL